MLARTGLVAGPLAGLLGGIASACSAAVRTGSPAELLRARADVLAGEGSWVAGLILHLGWAAALGALFAVAVRLASGIELALRGMAFSLLVWLVLRFAGAPLLAPGLPGPSGPALLDALVFGSVLGIRAPLARALLRRRYRPS